MYATLDLGVLLVGVVCCWKRRLTGRDRLGTELHTSLGQELAFHTCFPQHMFISILFGTEGICKGIRVRIVTIVEKP